MRKLGSLLSYGRRLTEVWIDEGGLRCVGEEHVGYVPFERLADTFLENDFAGRAILVLELKTGEVARLPLRNANPLEVHRTIVGELVARRVRPATRHSQLARRGRSLDAWLGAVVHSGHSGPYRCRSIDRATLLEVLRESHGHPEDRAAAAHALLADGIDDEVFEVALTLVNHAVPPLVLAAVRLAPGGGSLVTDEIADDTIRFLEPRDRDVVRLYQASRLPNVDGALERATRPTSDSSEHVEHKRRKAQALLPGTKSDMPRWIGRSWGL